MTEQCYQNLTVLYHKYFETVSPWDNTAHSDQAVADAMKISLEKFHEWEKEWDRHHQPVLKALSDLKRVSKKRR